MSSFAKLSMFGILSKNDWDRYYDQIFGYYFRRLSNRSDVEDLTAQTLNDFFLTKTEIQNPDSFIFQIAKNKLNTFLKSKYKNSLVGELPQEEIFGYVPEYEKFKSDLEICIEKHINNQDKQILELCVVEDFQSKEVAQKLGLSPGNVRIRLHRVLKLLKEKCKHLRQI